MKKLIVISFILLILSIFQAVQANPTTGSTILETSKLLATSQPLKIAVIDTGFDTASEWNKDSKPTLCDGEHKDFSRTGSIMDKHGHGTHIAGLIHKHIGNINYCLIIYKFYDPKGLHNGKAMIQSIKAAIKAKVDIINISGGGVDPIAEEKKVIKQALDQGIVVVAAAGNESNNKPYYPAHYDSRIVVVGNVNVLGQRAPTSNFGPVVDGTEIGENVLSISLGNSYKNMTGTSQSTAIATGKIAKELYTYKLVTQLPEIFGDVNTSNYYYPNLVKYLHIK